MAFLEIIHLAGDTEKFPLSKTSPLSIGTHRSNDIQVDEEGIELIHCRISWSKSGFEAVAAGVEPLDINGNQVQRATLKNRDVLRFGSVDIRYTDQESAEPAEDALIPDDDLGLKPITGEFVVSRDKPKPKETAPEKPVKQAPPVKPVKTQETQKAASKQVEKAGEKLAKKKSPPADSGADQGGVEAPADFGAALDALAQESMSEIVLPKAASEGPRAAKEKKKSVERPVDKPAEKPSAAETRKSGGPPAVVDFSNLPSDSEMEAPAEDEGGAGPDGGDSDDALSTKLRAAMRGQQKRPGDEDPLRHPLVLGLGGLAVVLVLAGAVFYFIAGRQSTQAQFDAAKALYDEGNFLSGIQELDKFLLSHPRHPLAIEAKRVRGYARIRQQIEGAVPNFAKGIEELRAFIGEQRDIEGFDTLHPMLAEMAKNTSLGAATFAGKLFDPSLLEISKEARQILKTYSPQDAPPTETLNQIEDTLRKSEAAILKDTVYKDHIAAIEQQLGAKRPLEAIKTRRDLLTRYAAFDRDRKVVALTTQTLDLEKTQCVSQAEDRPAVLEDYAKTAGGLSLVFQGRTRTDEVPVNQCVVAFGKNCILGLEFVTGSPVWRRVIGLDSPFPPIVDAASSGVFVFNTRHQEVLRIHQHTGQLIWRQPIGDDLTGQPLLEEGILYVTTAGGTLLSIDAETGSVTSQLTFSQPVTGPVSLSDGARLMVAGDQEVVYTLTRRPLECTGVFYTGQQAGSVKTPLLSMGDYVLMIENKGANARLHLLLANKDGKVSEISTASVQGRVLDDPAVIRGRDLFVPSTVERVSAFTVSDDPGQPPLTTGPVYQGKSGEAGPIHLLTGPDRQLWVATGSLTKLRLTTEALQQEGEPAARGTSSQPLQYISGYLFHGRKRAYTDAVTFTRTDRDTLKSDWQAVLGARILAWTASPNDPTSIACVNEAGQTFRIGSKQWDSGAFVTEAAYRLSLNEDLAEPLLVASLGDGRMGVAAGGPEPRAWIINAAGQSEASPQLPSVPEAAPVRIGKYVAVPCSGRLHALRTAGVSPIQDLILPTGEDHHWLAVVAADEERAVGVTMEGAVYLIRLQTAPQTHLAEAAKLDLGEPILFRPGVGDGMVAIADSANHIRLFEAERLESLGERTLPAPVTNNVFVQGGQIYVETGGDKLHCLSPDEMLSIRWEYPLDGSSVAGVLAIGDQVIVALQSGRTLLMKAETGEVVRELELEVSLSLGPAKLGERILVGSIDGTLIPVNSLLTGE